MNRRMVILAISALVVFGPLGLAACSTGDAKATEPLITLITCSELFHTDNRSVAIGELTSDKKGEPSQPQAKRQNGFLAWLVGLIQGIIDFFQGN